MCSRGYDGKPGTERGDGFWSRTLKPHSPVALPPTLLGRPLLSPYSTAGLFPEQTRLPQTTLDTVSLPSGAVVLPVSIRLPRTVFLMIPYQDVSIPVTIMLPPVWTLA